MSEERWWADQPGDDIWYVRDQEPISVARCRDQAAAEQIVADHNAAPGREPADAGEGERDATIEQLRAVLTRTTRALYRAIRTIDGMSDQTLPLDQFARRSELATIHVEACAILASPDWAARDAALAPPAGSPEPDGAGEGE